MHQKNDYDHCQHRQTVAKKCTVIVTAVFSDNQLIADLNSAAKEYRSFIRAEKSNKLKWQTHINKIQFTQFVGTEKEHRAANSKKLLTHLDVIYLVDLFCKIPEIN